MKKNIAIILLSLGVVASLIYARTRHIEATHMAGLLMECNANVVQAQMEAEQSRTLAEEQRRIAEMAMLEAQVAMTRQLQLEDSQR